MKTIQIIKAKLLKYLLNDLNDNNLNYKLALTRDKPDQIQQHKNKSQHTDRDREFIEELNEKWDRQTTPLPQRLQSHLDPEVDEIGGYFTYTGNRDHEYEKCVECKTQFTEGDKVYLTTKMNDLDLIVPFPYCTTCRRKHVTAQKL